MREFNGFTELAVLYAANAALVNKVQQTAEEEISAFLVAACELTKALLAEEGLEMTQDVTSAGIHRWRVPVSSPADIVGLYIRAHPEIVVPGRVTVRAGTSLFDPERRDSLIAVADSPEIAPHVVSRDGSKAKIFKLRISYDRKAADTALETVAEIAATTLRALTTAARAR